jgi:hypothetical protein
MIVACAGETAKTANAQTSKDKRGRLTRPPKVLMVITKKLLERFGEEKRRNLIGAVEIKIDEKRPHFNLKRSSFLGEIKLKRSFLL